MKMSRYVLLGLEDVHRLLAAGAIIKDELDYYNTLDGDQELGAPIYMNRGVIGIAKEYVLDALDEQYEDRTLGTAHKPTYLKEKLLLPDMPYHLYWYHKDNNEASLFVVEVKYTHEDVADREVIFSISDEVESLEDDVIELDEPTRKLYEALRIELGEDNEDEEEEEVGDLEEEHDDIGPDDLEWCVAFQVSAADDAEVKHEFVFAKDVPEAKEKFLHDKRGHIHIVSITLADEDDDEDLEEGEDGTDDEEE